MQHDYIIDKKLVPSFMLYNPSSPEVAEWYNFAPGQVY